MRSTSVLYGVMGEEVELSLWPRAGYLWWHNLSPHLWRLVGNHAHPATEQRRKLNSLMASANQARARLQPVPGQEFRVTLSKEGDVNESVCGSCTEACVAWVYALCGVCVAYGMSKRLDVILPMLLLRHWGFLQQQKRLRSSICSRRMQ